MPSAQMHGTDKKPKVQTNCRKLLYTIHAMLFQDPSITFPFIFLMKDWAKLDKHTLFIGCKQFKREFQKTNLQNILVQIHGNMSHVTCNMSHVKFHMSYVTCYMSHVTCRMLHITCPMTFLMRADSNIVLKTFKNHLGPIWNTSPFVWLFAGPIQNITLGQSRIPIWYTSLFLGLRAQSVPRSGPLPVYRESMV